MDDSFQLLRTDIARLDAKLDAEFVALRTEFTDEMRALRAEMREDFRAIHAELGRIHGRLFLGALTMVAALIGLMATVLAGA